MPSYFIHAPGRLPGGQHPPIPITHFEFNPDSQGMMFSDAIEVELHLMRKLLQAGYKERTGNDPGEPQEMPEEREDEEAQAAATTMTPNRRTAEEIVADSIERLRQQNEELRNGREDSPPQSPMGTPAPRDVDTVNNNNTPIDFDSLLLESPIRRRRSSTNNGQPLRRLSEPQTYTGTLGAGLDISPLRAGSASRAIPIRDPNTKSKTQATPTKAGKKISFTVDDTIDEEPENEDA
jgi:hypothetical protein